MLDALEVKLITSVNILSRLDFGEGAVFYLGNFKYKNI